MLLQSMRIISFVCLASLLAAPMAIAQSPFSPVVKVGDGVITRYQLDQRALFLSLLRAPGNPRELAKEQLINEAIQIGAAADAGYAPSPEAVAAGQAEFAGRANLTAEEFVDALAANGVDAATFRDFVAAGVAWRDFLRNEFGDNIRASIPDALVDRTFAQTGTEGGARFLLSEVLLPTGSEETRAASAARAEEIAALGNETDFAAAARRFSISPTRANGGERPWVGEEGLPPEVSGIIAALAVGQTSRPVFIEGTGIIIYHLREREDVASGTPETLDVDYALFITGPDTPGPSAIQSRIDRCDDLYGVAQGLPENRLIRETLAIGQLPADVRAAIATLDINETSLAVSRNGQPTVLMLCERSTAVESDVDRNIVGNRLLNARLGAVASNRLAELRARTTIIDLEE